MLLSLFYQLKTCFVYILFAGIYSFSIFYTTRLCGALSLCGPTVVEFYQNEQILRTFSRDLATDTKADQDMVRQFFPNGKKSDFILLLGFINDLE